MGEKIRVLTVDNYDSFVYTLVGYIKEFGADVHVVRNDDIKPEDFDEELSRYDGILVSPGPGNSSRAGISIEAILWAGRNKKPLLGVCLGHQALAEAYGGKIIHAPELFHGKTSVIHHEGKGIFGGLPTPLTVARYHSLIVDKDTVPEGFNVTATTGDGIVMALAHKTLPLMSVQFHPESVMTDGGYRMIAHWLEEVGLEGALERAEHFFPARPA